MASEEHPINSPAAETDTRPPRVRSRVAAWILICCLVAVEPATAQQNAVCAADRLPEMISGFFRLTTAIGLMGLVVVWQADSLVEMFTLHREQREGIKRHKRTALKSAVILVVLGPLYTVAGSMMNLPLAGCIDLVPW
ncbi:hypothetical protein [Halorarum salinum]|uniref:Uncharacterized protein n=1 Tax=Halorarum salinum TaxID=2743089 RepID=A0A7D5L8W9_9EURY|nr:hypothetical protein [Halobaculum salinum]QLG61066.1 hypothetical protein HUG12_04660 [Halobaculum salinum]